MPVSVAASERIPAPLVPAADVEERFDLSTETANTFSSPGRYQSGTSPETVRPSNTDAGTSGPGSSGPAGRLRLSISGISTHKAAAARTAAAAMTGHLRRACAPRPAAGERLRSSRASSISQSASNMSVRFISVPPPFPLSSFLSFSLFLTECSGRDSRVCRRPPRSRQCSADNNIS